jgi:mannose-6-phosphate isomerase-like protein (cupin superfamily)
MTSEFDSRVDDMQSTDIHSILDTYLHVREGGATVALAGGERFWQALSAGGHVELEQGRLLSAFTFTGPWDMWERHPAGEELVMLLAGSAQMLIEEPEGVRSLELETVGSFVLIPRGAWHTARADDSATLLFLTPGAGTEHRPV